MPKDYDILFVEELTIPASIGIYESEKKHKQTIEISIKATTEANNAHKSDDIEKAINYEILVEETKAIVNARHYDLVETLAETIAKAIQNKTNSIKDLEITIKKPDIIKEAKSIGITIRRYYK